MADTLNINAQIVCPHQGTVQIIASSKPLSVDGAPALLASEATTVAGCAFAPGGAASPCTTVLWSVTDTQVTTGGQATLSKSSVGLCYSAAGAAQGAVTVRTTQSKTSTR